MRKLFALFSLLLTAGYINAQVWVNTTSNQPAPAKLNLVSGSAQSSTIHLHIPGYTSNAVQVPNGHATIISLQGASRFLEAGAPDLLKVTASVIIPDNAHMTVQVTSSDYVDFQNIEIAPSKGNLTRNIDPSTVPYTYGPSYGQNQFFPGNLAALKDPFILRDLRGQTVVFYPFQYNPVTKVLRVYTDIVLTVSQDGVSTINTFARSHAITSIDHEFAQIYKHEFINYNANYKYTPLDEHGKMLIICDNSFMAAMQPFVIWKKTEGIPTEIVDVSTIGNTTAAIQAYVTNYYNTNGLTFLLLVGDASQVTTYTVAGGGSDNTYGYLAGGDHYQEIFVGRFSAESVADVQTQVTRTINYEKTPSTTPGKFSHSVGIGSALGPGDDNEYDFEHERNLLTQELGFTYTTRAELFDGSQGGVDAAGDPVPADLATEINNGTGIITYTGHGADNQFVTTGFSNSDVANLTNTNILPFIWSVACVEGNFTAGTCFAEAWLRQQYNNQPAGAVAAFMSTINQSWNPPMDAQDEMVNILTENAGTNIKRTYGGLSVNGLFKMNDTYADFNMTDTWTIFGDPSLMVRTANPASMTVTHNPTINIGATNLVVHCNVPGALVCLTIHHEIIGTGTVVGGQTTITFNPLTQVDTITVCATAFNYIPYLGTVLVVGTTYHNDAQMASIIVPVASYSCAGLDVHPKVLIRNLGSNNLTSANVYYKADAGSPVLQAWTGNLVQYAYDTITFPNYTLTTGSHVFVAYIANPNGLTDSNTVNDTLTKDFNVMNLVLVSGFTADQQSFCNFPATVQFTNQSQNALTYSWDFGDGVTSTDINPSHTYAGYGAYTISLTASAGVCGTDIHTANQYIIVGATPPVAGSVTHCGPASVVLAATGTGTINWYDAPTGGNFLITGNSYTTPVLSNTTTYYAEQSVTPSLEYVGKLQKENDASLHTNNSYYLIFNCYTPLVLKSVKIYAGSAGNRIVQLRDSTGTVIQSNTVNVPSGESRITLNFNLPVQNNMQLACGTANPDMYRDISGITFPYNLAGKISITGTNAAPTVRYYYYYNWEIESPACTSARVPVIAYINNNAPHAAFTYTVNGLTVSFTDASLYPALYSWDFGDGSTANVADPMHTYAVAGTYAVKLLDVNGCGVDSVIQNITVSTSGIAENNSGEAIAIYPNPAVQGNITFEYSSASVLKSIRIYNALGQIIALIITPANSSNIPLIFNWNASSIEPGVYYVSFITDKNTSLRKLVFTK